VDIVLALGGPEAASSLIRKRQWKPSEYSEWLYRLAERLFQPALWAALSILRVFPRVERNSAQLAVF